MPQTNNYVQKYVTSGGPLTDSIIFDDGTKVGIGTTSPGAKLHISKDAGTIPTISGSTALLINDNAVASDSVYLSLISGTTGTSRIQFGTSADEDRGYIDYNQNVDALTFITDTTEKVRIDTSGNVGIGTTGPGLNWSRELTIENTSSHIHLRIIKGT